MYSSAGKVEAYKRVNVETASQAKLIIMLFNGAIQRTEEAKRCLPEKKMQLVHDNLIRAQDIITELRSSLDMSAGEIARQIDRVYEYILHLLVMGNVEKDAGRLDEAVEHMTAMRDTWQEAFSHAELGDQPAPRPPAAGQRDSSVMDLRG